MLSANNGDCFKSFVAVINESFSQIWLLRSCAFLKLLAVILILVESCIKNFAKKYQYKKYKEVYEVNIYILKLNLIIKNLKIKI